MSNEFTRCAKGQVRQQQNPTLHLTLQNIFDDLGVLDQNLILLPTPDQLNMAWCSLDLVRFIFFH